MENDIKTLRIDKKLTQKELANLVGISLRSYISYENDETKKKSLKYNYIFNFLENYNIIDEDHGILEYDEIVDKASKILDKYNIDYCYIFGSYANNSAKETSDIDLLISAKVSGLKFFGLVEELRNSLNKKIDLLDVNQLKDNPELINEILKKGKKIYG